MIRSPFISVMTDAALKAAKSLRRDLGEVEALQVSMKGPGDFVSAADRRAEKIIRDALAKARPTYGLVMEESGSITGTDGAHRWHVDPLDGTTNFLHGIPQFCVSIGLERDGDFVAGVVYDPAKDEMFVAERGKGAYMNNRRIRVAGRRDFNLALIGDRDAPPWTRWPPAFPQGAQRRDGARRRHEAVRVLRRSTSPTWLAGASMRSGSATSTAGISARPRCWFARRAGSSARSTARNHS